MSDSNDDIFPDDDVKKDKKKPNLQSLAIQNIMRTEGGRDFIWGQLQSCGTFESMFNINPVQSAYNSGMRDAGLRLEREIKEVTPEYYVQMVKENING